MKRYTMDLGACFCTSNFEFALHGSLERLQQQLDITTLNMVHHANALYVHAESGMAESFRVDAICSPTLGSFHLEHNSFPQDFEKLLQRTLADVWAQLARKGALSN